MHLVSLGIISRFVLTSCGLGLWLMIASTALADLPLPRLDRLSPIGGNAGTTVTVTLVGNDLEGVESLWTDHPGLRAEFVKANEFKLHIAGDAPPGTYDLRAVGRFGISNPRLFSVSEGLTDVAEVEPNNTPATAQVMAINSAVQGTADSNGQDWFRIKLNAGQRIVIDCLSARLDTEMDPMLTLVTASGSPVASNGDYFGRDPFLDYTATTAGEFLVEVRDLIYRGGYPYRLLIHDRPQVENLFPRVVQAGKTVPITVFGRNLGPEGRKSPWTIAGQPLEQRTVNYTAPAELVANGGFRFREHPTQYSVIPTAATGTVVGEQFTAGGMPPAVLIVSEFPTLDEAEPNNTREQAQVLTLPVCVSGRFDKPADADWYEFTTDAEGGNYGFDVYCERIAGRSDPYLAVFDEQGNRVVEFDDLGPRVNAFDGHLRDPSGMQSLAGGKKFKVLVQDRYQGGGARAQYVLSLRKQTPDFFVACMANSPGPPQGTTLWAGGTAALDVIMQSRDGWNDPVVITAENLPAGVHATPVQITNDMRTTLVLRADDGAPPHVGPIRLIATSTRQGQTLRREVRPHTRVAQNFGCRVLREQLIAVRERAPFRVVPVPDQLTVEAGKPLELKLQGLRLWPEFTGEIGYQPTAFPNGFQLNNGTIGSGTGEVPITITTQPGMRPGTYSLIIQGQAQVPFNKDPNAKERPNTLVALQSWPLTVTVTEPPKK